MSHRVEFTSLSDDRNGNSCCRMHRQVKTDKISLLYLVLIDVLDRQIKATDIKPLIKEPCSG